MRIARDMSDEEGALLTAPQTLPQPLSWRSMVVVVSASMAVVTVGALISRWLVQYYADWSWVWIWGHPVTMVALIGGLVFALLRQENRRRQHAQRRLAIIAECNHHVRNSLQAIMLGAQKPEAHWLVIAEAVERIERVLTEVLPEAVDAPPEILPVSIRASASRSKRGA